MPKETFLNTVETILEEHIEDSSFGVSELASEIGLSRSQLHRKISALTGKSTSRYIREFRLEKALEILQNSDLTASEAAFQTGFNSASYFNSSFREHFGYPPGETKLRSLKSTGFPAKPTKNISKKNTTKWFISALLIIILLGVSFYVFREFRKKQIETIPIAVLPLKNLSSDIQYQYFLDGMREDLLRRLSQVEKLTVKSRQSSDIIFQSNLPLKDLGERLEVNYVLEGSFQKLSDSIKIIIHLLNTKTDVLVWSKEFVGPPEALFDLEDAIAGGVASTMNLTLNQRESVPNRTTDKETLEAYNAYLKGKHLLYQYTPEGLGLAHEYFEKSIQADSSFALAYAGMAEFFFYSSFPIFSKESLTLAKVYTDKALSFKETPAEAYRINGSLHSEAYWNWSAGESAYLMALEQDPNDCYSANSYARFLLYVKGDTAAARKLIEQAKANCPVFYYHYVLSAEHYLSVGELERALEEINVAITMDPSIELGYRIKFLIHFMQEDAEAALSALEQRYNLNPYLESYIPIMKTKFTSEGIDGVLKWINETNIKNSNAAGIQGIEYNTARNYALLQQHNSALDWLEKAYTNHNRFLFQVKYDPHFKVLHDHPRFLSLLNKMNLGAY